MLYENSTEPVPKARIKQGNREFNANIVFQGLAEARQVSLQIAIAMIATKCSPFRPWGTG